MGRVNIPIRSFPHAGCIAWFDPSVKTSAVDSTRAPRLTLITAIIGWLRRPT
jgi:hypothetical protein